LKVQTVQLDRNTLDRRWVAIVADDPSSYARSAGHKCKPDDPTGSALMRPNLEKLFGLDTLVRGYQPVSGTQNPGWAIKTVLPTSPSALNPANSRPKSEHETFLMTPEQH